METRSQEDQEDSPVAKVKLITVSLGRWQLFLPEEPDLHIQGQPFLALTMMYQSETHEYVWRVLGRLVEAGQVSSYGEIFDKCHHLFNSGQPCLGRKSPDAQFPISCQFSPKCSIMIPKTSSGTACSACLQSWNDSVQSRPDILNVAADVIYDDASKTLAALRQSHPRQEVWPCHMCSAEVPLADMKCHLEKSHLLSQFVCFHCDDRFVDGKDLSLHTLQKHPEIQELCCPSCPANIPMDGDIDSLTNHFRLCFGHMSRVREQDLRGRIVFECQICESLFDSKFLFEEHITECLASKPRAEIGTDRQHMKRAYPTKNPMTVSSKSTIALLSMLKSHQSKDYENGPSQASTCSECSKKINAKFLSRHLMFHHRIGDFKCSSCSLTFRRAEELAFHASHAHPFHTYQFCPNCNKKVITCDERQSLIDHMETCHKIIFLPNMKGERVPFAGTICADCGHIYRNKADQDRHQFHGCNLGVFPIKRRKLGPDSSKPQYPSLHQSDTFHVNIEPCPNLDPLKEVDEEHSIFLKSEPIDVTDDLVGAVKEEPPLQHSTQDPFVPNERTQVVTLSREALVLQKRGPVAPSGSPSSARVECRICFRKLTSRILPKHKMFRHKLGQFACSKCCVTFETAGQLTEHATAVHPEASELQCPNCKRNIAIGIDRKGLENHIDTCHKLKFLWDDEAHGHIQYVGRGCMDCGASFRNVEQLKVHEEKDVCASGEDASERRKRYVQDLIQGRKRERESSLPHLICDHCGDTFVDEVKLKYHQRSRHSVNPLVCSSCAKEFSNKTKLQYHFNRYHSTCDEFDCKDCSFRGGSVASLRDHRLIHGPPTFMCPTCGKRFKLSHNLTLHMRIHTGEKPYKCDLCHYKTAIGCNLVSHKKFVHEKLPRGKKTANENLRNKTKKKLRSSDL